MLPAQDRLRVAADFRATMRQGVRCPRPSLVMHARSGAAGRSRAGFIVAKAVGNAVQRNRVKRQLRHLAAAALPATPDPLDLVVRALPAAVSADLKQDFEAALANCVDRLAR